MNDKYKIYADVKHNIDCILSSNLSFIDHNYREMILNSIMTVLRDFIFSQMIDEGSSPINFVTNAEEAEAYLIDQEDKSSIIRELWQRIKEA